VTGARPLEDILLAAGIATLTRQTLNLKDIMNRFKSLVATLAIFALCSTAFAAKQPQSDTNDADAHAVGIITPNVATSVVAFDYYIRFRDTGEFGVCADGTDKSQCEVKQYLTLEQFVAKFYPKASYVGFRLLMSSTSGSDTYLYVYMKKKPQ
jgi:hypothetical protein